jgi:hypothetical protein
MRYPIPSRPALWLPKNPAVIRHEMCATASVTNRDVILAGRRGWHVAVGSSQDDGGVAAEGEDGSGIEGIERRKLTEYDLAAGELRDQIGQSCTGENRPYHPIRVVEVQTTPHGKRGTDRGGSTGPGSHVILRITTHV